MKYLCKIILNNLINDKQSYKIIFTYFISENYLLFGFTNILSKSNFEKLSFQSKLLTKIVKNKININFKLISWLQIIITSYYK